MIKIIKYDNNPITEIGKVAGICWGANTTDDSKNYKRGIDCLKNNHGRVMEYTDIEVVVEGYSARVIRELYTHIIGTSRLQASTRYVDYSDFDYYTPVAIQKNKIAKEKYDNCMNTIKDTYKALLDLGIKKEDIGGLLPLNSTTKIVLKINLRALIHMFNMRTCNRAYIEFRGLMKELKTALSNLSEEWKYLCDNYFVPKCIADGYCTETFSCNLMPSKDEVLNQRGKTNEEVGK